MNITLSVDDRLVERAREVARQQGTSLNALVRLYVEDLAGERSGAMLARDLRSLWHEKAGRSVGKPISRDDAYVDRLR